MLDNSDLEKRIHDLEEREELKRRIANLERREQLKRQIEELEAREREETQASQPEDKQNPEQFVRCAQCGALLRVRSDAKIFSCPTCGARFRRPLTDSNRIEDEIKSTEASIKRHTRTDWLINIGYILLIILATIFFVIANQNEFEVTYAYYYYGGLFLLIMSRGIIGAVRNKTKSNLRSQLDALKDQLEE